MITFNSLGRFGKLGNQMFQYAALFSLAKNKNYTFGIPLQNTEWGISAWYDCKLFLPSIFNITALNLNSIENKYQFRYEKLTFNPAFFELPDNIDILGYFQSEKYFKHCKEELLKEFTFKNINLVDKIKEEFKNKKFIGVHIRRGDYLKLPHIHKICNQDYYLKAFDYIQSNIKDEMYLYIFSDDIEWCKKNINFNSNIKIFFDDSPESEDKYYTNQEKTLIKMSLCDHFICANSSFSWWGSYIISNPNKLICMPNQWFGPAINENWSDIYYDGVKIL